jgi:hypothetical protein
METNMTDTLVEQWEKEQRLLRELIQNNPSADLDEKRDRLAVLTKLIAERRQQPA